MPALDFRQHRWLVAEFSRGEELQGSKDPGSRLSSPPALAKEAQGQGLNQTFAALCVLDLATTRCGGRLAI